MTPAASPLSGWLCPMCPPCPRGGGCPRGRDSRPPLPGVTSLAKPPLRPPHHSSSLTISGVASHLTSTKGLLLWRPPLGTGVLTPPLLAWPGPCLEPLHIHAPSVLLQPCLLPHQDVASFRYKFKPKMKLTPSQSTHPAFSPPLPPALCLPRASPVSCCLVSQPVWPAAPRPFLPHAFAQEHPTSPGTHAAPLPIALSLLQEAPPLPPVRCILEASPPVSLPHQEETGV